MNIGTQINNVPGKESSRKKNDLYPNKTILHSELLEAPTSNNVTFSQNNMMISHGHVQEHEDLKIVQNKRSCNSFPYSSTQETFLPNSIEDKNTVKNDLKEERTRLMVNRERLEGYQLSSVSHNTCDTYIPITFNRERNKNNFEFDATDTRDKKEKVIDNVIGNDEDNTSSYNCKLFTSPGYEQEEDFALIPSKYSTNSVKLRCRENNANSVERIQLNRNVSKVANKSTSTNTMISKSTSCIAKLSSKEQKRKQNFPKSRSITLRGTPKRKFDSNDKHFNLIKPMCNAIPSSSINIYDIPPPNYCYDPNRSIEKLL